MEDTLRSELEEAALGALTFQPAPAWFFLFLEEAPATASLFELVDGFDAAEHTEAIVAFAVSHDAASFNDAAAALYRMRWTAKDRCSVEFSTPLTAFFQMPATIKIREALGIPEGYACVGALRLDPGTTELPEEEPKWNVFSYVRP